MDRAGAEGLARDVVSGVCGGTRRSRQTRTARLRTARCPRCGGPLAAWHGAARVRAGPRRRAQSGRRPLGGLMLGLAQLGVAAARAHLLDRDPRRFADLAVLRRVRSRRCAAGSATRSTAGPTSSRRWGACGSRSRPGPRQRPRPGPGPGRRAAAVLDDRHGRPAAGGQAAGPGPPDLSALLRRGGVGPVAGLAHRAAALPGAHPG